MPMHPDDRTTAELRDYLNHKDIPAYNIEEDAIFIYFDTDNMTLIMHLAEQGYELLYKEHQKPYDYHARVLKPNWFSAPLREEMQQL